MARRPLHTTKPAEKQKGTAKRLRTGAGFPEPPREDEYQEPDNEEGNELEDDELQELPPSVHKSLHRHATTALKAPNVTLDEVSHDIKPMPTVLILTNPDFDSTTKT